MASIKFTLRFMLMITLLPLTMHVSAEEQPSINKLQRLFTTPYERAQLDAMRRREKFPDEQPQPGKLPALPPLQVEVKGLVVRKDAPNVVWVNDGNTLEGKKIDDRISVNGQRVSKSGKVPVSVNGKRIRMQPGQVWDEVDETITDTYAVKRENSIEEVIEQIKDTVNPDTQIESEDDAGDQDKQ